MTFDSDISEDISLSKILDCFLIEDENPETIVSFLKQHDASFKDILNYSLYCNKLFQLDFFLKCNENTEQYIISKLKDIPLSDAAFLTWQIMRSESLKAQHIKYAFRKELQWILKHGPKHPYSFRHESYICPVDNICFKLAESDNISSLIDTVDYKKLCNYFKYVNYSLFQNRLLQYDIFCKMNDISKFVFIRDTFSTCNKSAIRRFVMQLFDSDEDIEVKKLCLNNCKQTLSINNIIDKETSDIIDNSQSFAEMMLKMTIFNIDIMQRIVLYLLLYKSQWIIEWIEYDKNDLDKYLKISCLHDILVKMHK